MAAKEASDAPTVKEITIAPNGDALLVLKHAKYDLDFLPWPLQHIRDSTLSVEPCLMVDISDTYDLLGGGMVRPSLKSAAEPTIPLDIRDGTITQEEEDDESFEYHYLVSMRQLRNTSAFFANIFKHGFIEAQPKDDGKYYISAEDFHPEVLTHVLNIVHTQNRDVSEEPNVRLLANIAVIMDYYRLHDALAAWSKIWESSSQMQCVDDGYSHNTIIKLFVSLIFGWKENFTSASIVTGLHCPDFTQALGPPLESVLNKVFSHRLFQVDILNEGIDRLETSHKEGGLGCSDDGCRKLITEHIQSLREHARLLTLKNGGSFSDVTKDMQRDARATKECHSRKRTTCCPMYDSPTDPLSIDMEIDYANFRVSCIDIRDFDFDTDGKKATYEAP
jgi:hypothetical protein